MFGNQLFLVVKERVQHLKIVFSEARVGQAKVFFVLRLLDTIYKIIIQTRYFTMAPCWQNDRQNKVRIDQNELNIQWVNK